MSACLTRRGVSVALEELEKHVKIRTLCRVLTIVVKMRLGRKTITKKAQLYKFVSIGGVDHMMVPRFAAFTMLRSGTLERIKVRLADGLSINTQNFTIVLHENQNTVVNYLMERVYTPRRAKKGLGGCVLQMDAGLGKSYIGAALIHRIARKTLVVVPTFIILSQWVKLLTEAFPDLNVGQYSSKKKKDGDIVVMVVNSVLSKEFKFGKRAARSVVKQQRYLNEFGFVILDEIHKYASNDRRKIFWELNRPYVLGMTATPNHRLDKLDAAYRQHVGRLIRAESIPGFDADEVVFTGTVRVLKYSGPPEHTKRLINSRNGYLCNALMIKQFSADPYRNRLIVRQAVELYGRGKNVFIFSDNRAHLLVLRDLLAASGLVAEVPESREPTLRDSNAITYSNGASESEPSQSSGISVAGVDSNDTRECSSRVSVLMGGAKQADVAAAKEKARIILVTYHYGDTGMSIDRFNALIFASPRKSLMDQKVGRILRRGGDSSHRIIVDIVDWETSLKSQYYYRAKTYREKNFQIEKKKISWESL